jgi:heme-degrading monooxygenase HmoA
VIARIWHARATAENHHAYIDHFHQNVAPELHRINGFISASLLKEVRHSEVAFLVITKWASEDAIRAFAGHDITKAVVEPEAQQALMDFDRTVQHWEIVEETTRASGQDV